MYQATHCMVTYMYCTCRWKGDNVLLLLYNFKDLHLYLHVTWFTAAELSFSLSMAKQSCVFDKF